MKIARIGLHYFEEPCISGEKGSGTIFFSGCTLRCVFCQNYNISQLNQGVEITERELGDAMLYLQDIGAENINLVTPALYQKSIKNSLYAYKSALKIPIVWNSSGYENAQGLKELEGLVDVWLPDFKYSDDGLAWRYSHAKNYFEIATEAIKEMRRQRSKDVFDQRGMMQSGVIVRHLVLPSHVINSQRVLERIAEIDRSMYVSVMSQYFPTANVTDDKVLGRRVTKREYAAVTDKFFEVGLTNGFAQEPTSATEDYVPDFDLNTLQKLLDGFAQKR